MALLEICCYSIDCALTAEKAGADRIELCSGLRDGGLTPSYGTLYAAAQQLKLPVHPIVRPRGGDFCYSVTEFASMLSDIAYLRELGFAGLVTGVLSADGQPDMPRMRQIMRQAEGMAVTFHRAFDLCRDAWQALAQLTDAGVARILTSGQQPTAHQGLALIAQLAARSPRPCIMAGAGVRLSQLPDFIAAGISELHSSAGHYVPSLMRYRHDGVSMSGDDGAGEYVRYQVDADTVAAMKALLCAA